MMLTQTDAIAIAKKLEAEIKPGRKHDLVKIRLEGKYVGQFGIQRCSKEKPHNYIAKQMFITSGQCREFRDCSLSVKDYIELLRAKSALA
jgi:hypothetical protein